MSKFYLECLRLLMIGLCEIWQSLFELGINFFDSLQFIFFLFSELLYLNVKSLYLSFVLFIVSQNIWKVHKCLVVASGADFLFQILWAFDKFLVDYLIGLFGDFWVFKYPAHHHSALVLLDFYHAWLSWSLFRSVPSVAISWLKDHSVSKRSKRQTRL